MSAKILLPIVLAGVALAVMTGAPPAASAQSIRVAKLTVQPEIVPRGATITFAAQYEVSAPAGAIEVEEQFVLHSVEFGQVVKKFDPSRVSRSNGPVTSVIDFAVPRGWLDGLYTVRVVVRPVNAAASNPEPLIEKFRVDPKARAQGAIVLRSRVDDVAVWLDSDRLGNVGPGRDLVTARPAGKHRVRAEKDGHAPWEREIVLAQNRREEVVIDITPLGPPKSKKGNDDAEMLLVDAGKFLMGSDQSDDEKPRREVDLDRFYIDKYEITNALYERFRQATRRPPSPLSSNASLNAANQPVVGVNWSDADAYCKWAGRRLPTEAEWEKAARGTDGRTYPWGNQWDPTRANSGAAPLGKTATVGSYPRGVGPYGAHDMAGNVAEWVADRYAEDYYRRSPNRNPAGPDAGDERVVRGGDWFSLLSLLRTSSRAHSRPTNQLPSLGFRCASAP